MGLHGPGAGVWSQRIPRKDYGGTEVGTVRSEENNQSANTGRSGDPGKRSPAADVPAGNRIKPERQTLGIFWKEQNLMKNKTYSIFGAGAAGLFTAWRLLDGIPSSKNDQAKQLSKGDTLELYDWGKYDFSKEEPGTRAAGARVCTWHYKNDKKNSYLELGGMRYSEWDTKPSKQFPDPNDGKAPGHRLVTTVIEQLGLKKYSVP